MLDSCNNAIKRDVCDCAGYEESLQEADSPRFGARQARPGVRPPRFGVHAVVGRSNARWWEYVRRFQGIDPPGERGESFCDLAPVAGRAQLEQAAEKIADVLATVVVGITGVLVQDRVRHVCVQLMQDHIR